MALRRLLEQETSDGKWRATFDLSSLCAAVYIIMLRTTGLIDQPGSPQEEALLVRHAIKQVNADGGFFKYPGSPSSKSLTRLVLLALRMVMGEVGSGYRPQRWFLPNEEIDNELIRQLRETMDHAGRFLREAEARAGFSFEFPDFFIEKMLTAYVNPQDILIPFPFFEPEILAWMSRSRLLSRVLHQISPMSRKIFPAVSIIHQRIQEQSRSSRPILSLLQKSKGFRRLREKASEELARQIRAEQNENGGWIYNSLFAPLNILALLEAGVPMHDSAICRGIQFVRDNMFQTDGGGSFISYFRADTWDVCLGVISYLRIPGHSCLDEEIRPAIEFLLQSQNEDGSFAWASGSRNDPETDSTAHALLALSLAVQRADEWLRSRIRRALQKGMAYLLSRQSKRGGFSVWENTWVKIGPGSHGAIKMCLFDVAHADLTARVLSALAELGLTEEHETVRKGLRFLLDMQCRNGAWWCHWWAGYLSGTGYVLEALGRLGLRYGAGPSRQGKLLAEAYNAMTRAIAFFLRHQNPDGGWGETVKADFDMKEAGSGESSPLHTAFVLLNLLACGYPVDAREIQRGYEYLLGAMTPDGRWEDDQATFTVIPRTLYYRYPLANYVLPLNAMTSYLQARGEER